MINNFKNSNILRVKASKLIPGGAHTYSKGDDQFPSFSPHSIVKGKGARIIDVDGNEFVDWGMGLSSVILGHAYKEVVDVIKSELDNGSNFIRPSFIEAEFAEEMIEQIPSAEMVKFAKNGSNATSSAVKLARAYTKRDFILKCADDPFLSIDDWFICDTKMNAGVLEDNKSKIASFKYNDIEDFKNKIELHKDKGIACVIMEPVSLQEPKDNFLQKIRKICDKENIVLIFDEVVSGFRFHPRGASYLYNVQADLSSFGKAIANGYSLSALVGKKEIMELGGISHNKKKVFLLSSTYGGETHHLRAGQKTIKLLNQNNYEITKHIWSVGKKIKNNYNILAKKYNIQNYTLIKGIDCRPYFYFKDNYLRTIFTREMIKQGVLIQAIFPSFSHKDSEISQSIEAFDKSLKFLAYVIDKQIKEDIDVIKPVFRDYN